jgi:hypothetical protein
MAGLDGGSLGTFMRMHAYEADEEETHERLTVLLVYRDVVAEYNFITVVCLVFRATKAN